MIRNILAAIGLAALVCFAVMASPALGRSAHKVHKADMPGHYSRVDLWNPDPRTIA